MKSLEALFISFCLIASCACNPEIYNPGTGYNPPTTPDKPSVPEEPEEPETPEEPGTDPAEKDGTLYADGNDAKTYELILACGYNHEAPDNWHPEGNVRHIGQSYDKELDKYVFDFHLHILTDGDKDKPLKDRQRNEIKTDAGSPASMVAQNGETLRMTWKFRLPEGMKTTKSFSHIHQLKGIDNKAGTADVAAPVITFTARSQSDGRQQFQVIYVGPTADATGNVYLAKTDLADFLGEWVEVEETVKFAENGSYSVKIKRISDGKVLVSESGIKKNFWRDGTTGMRPKWGLYRSFGTDGSMKDQLRDETLKFADFKIEKLD